MEKLLPQNIEAEQAVLGSIEIDPDALDVVAPILRPTDFYRWAHETIYDAMRTLHRAHEPADLITLTDELARLGKLDEVGGTSYVTSLANQVPTSANVAHYARIVERTAVLRRIIHAAGQIAALAYNEPDADVAIAQAHRLLLEATQRYGEGRDQALVPFGVALDEQMDDVLARMERHEGTGITTGFAALDEHIHALERGDLVYLCGVPGSGKSTLAHNIISHVALECEARGEGTVAWVTLEMRKQQVANNIICAHAGVNGRKVQMGFHRPDGTLDTAAYHRYRAAWEALREPLHRRLLVRDRGCTVQELRAAMARAVAEHGCRLVVVDYIGLLSPEQRRQDEYQRISDMSRDLKQMAQDLGVVVLCLVQMSREHERRANKRPVKSDLRDSGHLEQDPDWIWGLYRPTLYEPARAARDEHLRRFAELGIIKARRNVADGAWVPLRAELEFSRFVDWPQGTPWPVDESRADPPTSAKPSQHTADTRAGAWFDAGDADLGGLGDD